MTQMRNTLAQLIQPSPSPNNLYCGKLWSLGEGKGWYRVSLNRKYPRSFALLRDTSAKSRDSRWLDLPVTFITL